MTTPRSSQTVVALSAADAVLKKKGRSFHWARRLLCAEHAARATRLYSFCRYLDDLADEASSVDDSRLALAQARLSIKSANSDNLVIQDGISLIRECAINPWTVGELIDGVSSDLDTVCIADLDGLLRYCYQVAGTVGLMMCKVLDADDSAAWPHAVDLGIAMQLTNICRDVQADALAGRRYLPGSMVGNMAAAELVHPVAAKQDQIQCCIRKLLDIADGYYRSGELGLSYLPLGARTGILTAARLYRAIGTGLKARQYRYWQGRVVVNRLDKTLLTVQALVTGPSRKSFWRPTEQHDDALHHPLATLLKAKPSATTFHGA